MEALLIGPSAIGKHTLAKAIDESPTLQQRFGVSSAKVWQVCHGFNVPDGMKPFVLELDTEKWKQRYLAKYDDELDTENAVKWWSKVLATHFSHCSKICAITWEVINEG